MQTILHVDASARQDRSLSRQLGRQFISAWRQHRRGDMIIHCDIGQRPPPAISEAWIAAAFTPELQRTAIQQALLALSDHLIDQISCSNIILIATPMYNYGMPASLKAWIDQVVRINRTFSFDLARGDFPLKPLLSGKTMVVLTSAGEFGFGPGEEREQMNHLIPHLRTVSSYLGVEEDHHIGIEYQEFGDVRHERSIADAKEAVSQLARQLTIGR